MTKGTMVYRIIIAEKSGATNEWRYMNRDTADMVFEGMHKALIFAGSPGWTLEMLDSSGKIRYYEEDEND